MIYTILIHQNGIANIIKHIGLTFKLVRNSAMCD